MTDCLLTGLDDCVGTSLLCVKKNHTASPAVRPFFMQCLKVIYKIVAPRRLISFKQTNFEVKVPNIAVAALSMIYDLLLQVFGAGMCTYYNGNCSCQRKYLTLQAGATKYGGRRGRSLVLCLPCSHMPRACGAQCLSFYWARPHSLSKQRRGHTGADARFAKHWIRVLQGRSAPASAGGLFGVF